MGASLLITLREGLEMALIVAILLAYLRKIGRFDQARSVWIGVGVAVFACVTAAVIFSRFVSSFRDSSAEPWVEGVLSLTAGIVLTMMIFWMRGHSRGIAGALHTKVDSAIDRGGQAVAIIAFASVAREGFETVLFLIGAQSATTRSGTDTAIGGVIGLVLSSAFCVVIYRFERHIDLRRFFSVTGGFLIVFAAGMLAKAVFELVEAMHLHSLEGSSLWTINSGVFAKGWFYEFISSMFGFTSSEATPIRVIVYLAYLIPVAYLFFSNRSGTAPSPVENRDSHDAHNDETSKVASAHG